MARVVNKNVGGTLYLQVVEDYQTRDGLWKQKVLRSFGPAANLTNYFQAVQYAAVVNAFKERLPQQVNASQEQWTQAAAMVLGGLALAWLLKHVIGKR